ncbi:MAG: SPOR domain-containing protein, partial [Bacteroidales bacterium]
MKKIIISLVLLFLFITGMVQAQEVKVTNNIPGLCKSGDRCIVEITIEKGAVEGFARIQQTLPDGIRAELVSDGGSDFTFDKQSVRFIWLSVPATPVIKVSYRLTFDAGLSGTYSIGEGVFSCLVDNKIQKYTLTPVMVEVNPKPVAVAAVPKVEPKPEVKPEPKPEEKVEPVAVAKEPVAEVSIPKQEVPAGGIIRVDHQPQTRVEPEMEAEPVSRPARNDSLIKLPVERQEPKQAEPEIQVVPVAKPQSRAAEPGVQLSSPSAITYAVQFAALKSYREPTDLKQQFRISEDIRYESADGWHRYFFGAWGTQVEAEAARRSFADRTGKAAFVVKMQNGK